MTKTATTTLVNDLSLTQVDATAVSRFYDDVIHELGKSEVLVRASLIASTAGTRSYSLPAAAIERVQTFFDSRTLDELSLQEAESVNRLWRDTQGEPLGVLTETETEDTFSLLPTPDVSSGSVAGGNFGTGFVEYAISSLHTNFESDVLVWLELPIAFEVLYREFSRESNHRDTQFAQACRQLALVLFRLLGIETLKREEK